MLTILFVNAGNYLYNLLLGRILGPSGFADAAILITLLLVLSFIGITFQVTATKYTVLLSVTQSHFFLKFIFKYAMLFGVILGCIVAVFSTQLQEIFKTKTSLMFILFGLGLPIYFIMSINRGLYQGKNDLRNLSKTYYFEMLCRLIVTLLLLYFLPQIQSSIIISLGILISFAFGLIPFQKIIYCKNNKTLSNNLDKKSIITFFALTAFYELTQIIINNSDIMLVKHYFDNEKAGLYASLALIGRVVYFVAWMFVMLLLPKVIHLKKKRRRYTSNSVKICFIYCLLVYYNCFRYTLISRNCSAIDVWQEIPTHCFLALEICIGYFNFCHCKYFYLLFSFYK